MLSITKLVLSSKNSDYRLKEIIGENGFRNHYWERKPEYGVFQKIENATYLNPEEVEKVFDANYPKEEIFSYIQNKTGSLKSEEILNGGKIFWIEFPSKEVLFSGDILNIKKVD